MTEKSLQAISEFLDEAGYFYMATTDGDQPKLRPLGGHHIFDGRLMFTVGDHKNVYKQMQANPKVELSAFVKGKWLRFSGKAVFETDSKYSQMAMKGNKFLQNAYDESTGHHLVLFHLEDEHAAHLDGAGQEVEVFN